MLEERIKRSSKKPLYRFDEQKLDIFAQFHFSSNQLWQTTHQFVLVRLDSGLGLSFRSLFDQEKAALLK
jgi:hypothetical protein